MTTSLPKYPPSSVRPGTSTPLIRGTRFPEPRPYLIPGAAGRRVSQAEKSFALFPHESEDARLTGSTRSLFRRLLALNLPVTVAESVAMRSRTTITTSISKTA